MALKESGRGTKVFMVGGLGRFWNDDAVWNDDDVGNDDAVWNDDEGNY
jgi:hypothetical protein